MEKETSALVGLGVVLIAIAVVISLGFGALQVGKRLTNTGQNDLVTSIDYAESQKFDEYNNTVVTGLQITGNLSSFINSQGLTVLINTNALSMSDTEGVAVNGSITDSPDRYSCVKIDTGYGEKLFINYGKVVDNSFSLELDSNYKIISEGDDTDRLEVDDGKVTLLDLASGNTFTDLSSIFNDGTMFIRDGSTFNSYLLNDISGVTCGIVFEQIK